MVIAHDYQDPYGNFSNIGSDSDESAFHDGLAMVFRENKYGFIDKSGKVVIPIQFQYAMPFSEGLAAVSASTDALWVYIDKTGKPVISLQLKDASPFSDHLASVERNGKCFRIDPSGNTILRFPESSESQNCSVALSGFSDGLAGQKFGS